MWALLSPVWLGTMPCAGVAQESEPLTIQLDSPTGLEAVFGQVEVVVHVGGEEGVRQMDLLVDGKPRGQRAESPWRFVVDVGQENRERSFEVVAVGVGGTRARSAVTTPAVRVDEEVAVELRQLYVTATDRNGERVLDLGRNEFRVRDQGHDQRLVTFARGDVPITAALLIDSSESMRGDRLRSALRGTRAFVEGMRQLDEAAVLAFSDRLSRSTPFTGDVETLLGPLDGLVASGNTATHDHLYLALQLLERRQGRRVVVLFTDGADLHSVLDMEEVAWTARRSQALIYWIRLDEGGQRSSFATAWRDGASNERETELLEQVVERSGGRVASLESIEGVEEAFRDILAELREQYVLGYYPRGPTGEGGWRKVSVETGRPGVRLRTRDGYVDRGSSAE